MERVAESLKNTISSLYQWGSYQADKLLDAGINKIKTCSKALLNYESGSFLVVSKNGKTLKKITAHPITSPLYWKEALHKRLKQDTQHKNLFQLQDSLEFYLSVFQGSCHGSTPIHPTVVIQILYERTKEHSPLLCLTTLIFMALPYFAEDPPQRLQIFQQILSQLSQINKKDLFFFLVHFRVAIKDEQEEHYWNKTIQTQYKELFPLAEKAALKIINDEQQCASTVVSSSKNEPTSLAKFFITSLLLLSQLHLAAAGAYSLFKSQISSRQLNNPGSLKQLFQKEILPPRQDSFLRNNRFSLQFFLEKMAGCNTLPCIIPEELSSLDCRCYYLEDVDFANTQGENLTWTAPYPSKCTITNARFENSSFIGMHAENLDFSGSTARQTTFEGSKFTNVSFEGLQAKDNVSFAKISAKNSSWKNVSGKLNLFESNCSQIDFGQDIDSGIKSVEYNFTGARVNGAQFNADLDWKVVDINLTWITEAHPQGTFFNDTNFNLHPKNGILWDYSQNVQFFFNLKNTFFSNTILYADISEYKFFNSNPKIFYGGNLENVSFPDGFSFPLQSGNKIGCTYFNLSGVAACGRERLTNYTYSCLTQDCPSVKVSNKGVWLTEQFEEASINRNSTDGYFSVNQFLKQHKRCAPNALGCTLPRELSIFDCRFPNLKNLDLTYLIAKNSTLLPKDGYQCDLSGSKLDHTYFEDSIIKNGLFNNLQGKGSFARARIEDSFFESLSGNFNFSEAILNGTSFSHVIPMEGEDFKKVTYDFTGAVVNNAHFDVIYPWMLLSTVNAQFKFVTNPHPSGSFFNNIRFNFINYEENSVYWCNARVGWLFNITDAYFSSLKATVPYTALYCNNDVAFFGGNFTQVYFDSHFSFPINPTLRIGCTPFVLDHVSACNKSVITNIQEASCLIPSCDSITVLGQPTTQPTAYPSTLQPATSTPLPTHPPYQTLKIATIVEMTLAIGVVLLIVGAIAKRALQDKCKKESDDEDVEMN